MISLTITINDSAPYATQTIAPESLFGEGLFLGRASDAGIHLDDVSISRKHARLYISEGVFYIVDIGSRSGTDVDGNTIAENTPVVLGANSTVSVGPYNIHFDFDEKSLSPQKEEVTEVTVLAGALASSYQPVATVAEDKWKPWKGKIRVTCTNIIQETHDVRTFVFTASPETIFRYKPGQFATLHLTIDGKPVNRSYTISSTPSRPHTITHTVKRVPAAGEHPPGQVSNWLHNNMTVGQHIEVSGPFGDFNCHDHPSQKLCFISGGSGITPMLSMTRWLCDTQANVDITFVHVAKEERDLIAREELEWLSSRHANLSLVFSLTRAENNSRWSGYRGRLDESMLTLAVPDFSERRLFVCGPEAFMSATKSLCESLKFPMDKYHEESFGGPAKSTKPSETTNPKQENSPQFGLRALLRSFDTGSSPTSKAKLAPQTKGPFTISLKHANKSAEDCGGSILESAEAAGLSLPFGCRQGMCGACKQKITQGNIIRDDQYDDNILDNDERNEGYVLCCIARPAGDIELDL